MFLWLLKDTKTKDNALRRKKIWLLQRLIPNSHDQVKPGPRPTGQGKRANVGEAQTEGPKKY